VDQNLVLVDGSVSAQNAAHLAVRIAKSERQWIQGLYIIDETLVYDTYANYQKELGGDDQPDSRAELSEWFEAVGRSALDQLEELCVQADIPIKTQILLGGVPDLILDHSARAQMLTLGRRGRGHAVDPEYLGSNFRHIAHHARIPLLVGGDVDRPINHLFLLNEGGSQFDRALDWTVRLHNDLRADVDVAVVDQSDPNTIPQDIEEQMAKRGLTDYHHLPILQDDISGLLETIIGSGADLLLIGGYHHPELLEWLSGCRIDQILRKTQLPVLIA
jgi:nucleotide-binding universal stress UspA family protein